MTEYQKKKLIDLILVIIAIVIVGLFLRTQLINPIILDTESTSEQPLEVQDGRIIIDQYATDLYKTDAISIQAINRSADEQYLDVQLVLNPFDEQNIADFGVEIEMASDDVYTIVVNSSGGKSLSEIITNVNEAYFENKAGEILSEISVAEGDHLIQIQVPNSKRLNLGAFMPLKVTLKYKIDDLESIQYYPE